MENQEQILANNRLKNSNDRGSKRAYWQRKCTAWIRLLSQSKVPWVKNTIIFLFAWYFGIDQKNRLPRSGEKFSCFDDFFTGDTKTSKQIPKNFPNKTIGSPVEGVLLRTGHVDQTLQFDVKGHKTSLLSLLMGDFSLASSFDSGFFAHFYLAPRHYHRIHMPCDGNLIGAYHVPGSLYSVKPSVLGSIPGIMSTNERVVIVFETAYGPMAVVLVGAFLVGSIETAWSWSDNNLGRETFWVNDDMPNIRRWTPKKKCLFKRGEELGCFHFGSSVLIFVGDNTVDALLSDAEPIALYQPLARSLPPPKS
jgi:phosphatidylserine decarboxylase